MVAAGGVFLLRVAGVADRGNYSDDKRTEIMANPDDVAIVLKGADAIAEARLTGDRSKYPSFDLSDADLSSANLDGANLKGVKLWSANLSGAILPEDLPN